MCKKLLLLLLLILITSASGCTDARWDQLANLGNRAEIHCYSGEKLVFHALSTGKVMNEERSDGYFARWKVLAVDGEWRHIDISKPVSAGVSGNCVLIYLTD